MKHKIGKYLEEKGFQVEISEFQIITSHQFDDFELRIAGELTPDFPRSMPKLYLLDRTKYGLLAHVGWEANDNNGENLNKGIICEGVSINRHIDYSQPWAVYLLALQNALKTIKALLSDKKRNETEILEEFSAHWRFSVNDPNRDKVISFLEPAKAISDITPIVTSDSAYSKTTCFVQTTNS